MYYSVEFCLFFIIFNVNCMLINFSIMKEEFLQYLWANFLYKESQFITYSGKVVELLKPGTLNRDAGPDFFNARIRMDGVELAGNVEIHFRNSDWYRHGHHEDAAYNNVILSVVCDADVRIYNKAGNEIETIVPEYSASLYDEYLYILGNAGQPACRRALEMLDDSGIYLALPGLAIERLERKCKDIQEILSQTHNDWEECFYRLLCKYWAGNVNAEPFYQLSLRMPYKVLLKYADKLPILESLLLGVSGLLDIAAEDDYVRQLKNEYCYLQAKHKLVNLEPSVWKFMRVRPDVFPPLRMALLASFLRGYNSLVSRVLEASSLTEAIGLLSVAASPYWDTHYSLGKESARQEKRMGENIKKIIIINAIVPFMFLYGRETGDEKYAEKAVDWLGQLSAERNYIIEAWERCGFTFSSAMQTQALIQLRKEYCDQHRCLSCRIGCNIFAALKE